LQKLFELEITSNKLASDLICIAEVQSQNLDTLRMAYFNEFIKHRPHYQYLDIKGGRVMIFCRDNLSLREVNVPGINEHDEIIWIKVKPKVLPHPLTKIIVGGFYYSPDQKSEQCRDFLEMDRLITSSLNNQTLGSYLLVTQMNKIQVIFVWRLI